MTGGDTRDEPVAIFEATGDGGFVVAATGGDAIPALDPGTAVDRAHAPTGLPEALAAARDTGRAVSRRVGAAWLARVTPLTGGAGAPLRLLCRFEPVADARRDLARWPDFFQIVIDAVPVPIFIKDADGRYVFCNAAFVAFQGRAAHAFIGRTVFETAPEELAWIYHSADRALFERGGDQIYEAQVRRADGGDAEVVFHKAVFRGPDGEAGGIIGAILDITDRKAAERELRAATLAADHANRMKSQFLVTMSHELRTPLNAILGFSEVIKDQLCGPVGIRAYAEYAADIHTGGEHLLSLINDILDLSKIEAGRVELERRELNLPDLLGGAIRLVLHRAQARRVSLRLDMAEPAPRLVADERAVKQILFNLLGNAVKFTPARGRVVLSAANAEDGGIVITIADTGAGIPPDQIERVLRPFERLDNRYGQAEEGTGLGLALVKALTELHGGALAIDSAPGAGTRVTVHFPTPP